MSWCSWRCIRDCRSPRTLIKSGRFSGRGYTVSRLRVGRVPQGGIMKTKLCIAACIAIAVSACGPSVRVTTTAAPNATFTQLHKFRILTPPPRRTGRPLPDDPMLVNSISNQVLQTSITDAFVARGYLLDPATPDFTIAYY